MRRASGRPGGAAVRAQGRLGGGRRRERGLPRHPFGEGGRGRLRPAVAGRARACVRGGARSSAGRAHCAGCCALRAVLPRPRPCGGDGGGSAGRRAGPAGPARARGRAEARRPRRSGRRCGRERGRSTRGAGASPAAAPAAPPAPAAPGRLDILLTPHRDLFRRAVDLRHLFASLEAFGSLAVAPPSTPCRRSPPSIRTSAICDSISGSTPKPHANASPKHSNSHSIPRNTGSNGRARAPTQLLSTRSSHESRRQDARSRWCPGGAGRS